MAIAGLKAKARSQLQSQGREAMAYSQSLPATINVDGIDRPTTNSNGKPIHYTEDGIRNFWRWIDGLERARLDRKNVEGNERRGNQGSDYGASEKGYFFDDQGRPRVFYHGTTSDITAFDRDHKWRLDQGGLGRGVYVASDASLAEFYANRKGDRSCQGRLAKVDERRRQFSICSDNTGVEIVTVQRNDISADVQVAILHAIEQLRWLSGRIADPIYRDDLNRDGLAMNLEAEANLLEDILQHS